MIRTWIPITIPTRIVLEWTNPDGTSTYTRRAVIAFCIDDAGVLTYMGCGGLDYTSKPRQFAFTEQLQNGVWQS
jgi:hypothetical protein